MSIPQNSDAPAATPLKGEICSQFIRCNKPGCHCRAGAPHGPYFYRVWREGGRVHKQYVKADALASVREACDAYRTLSGRLREMRQQREQVVRHIRGECRKAERLLRHSSRAATKRQAA